MEKKQLEDLKKDVVDKFRRAENSFAETSGEEREFLQKFALICLLSFDVYMKKMIVEKLVTELANEIKISIKIRKRKNFMKAFMDLHTHSLAAGHAYSTLLENIDAALAVGIRYLGMSEHGPASPGGPHEFFFSNYKVIPREYDREEVSGRVVPVTGGRRHVLCGGGAHVWEREGAVARRGR